MSSTDSATCPAFLHDLFGRILDGQDLPPQTLKPAYWCILNLVANRVLSPSIGSSAFVEIYDFIRGSLSDHIRLRISEVEARDVPKLAPPTAEALKTIDGVCHYLQSEHIATQGLEEVSAFAARTSREAAAQKILSDPQLLSDWLRGAIEGVRQGIEPSDDEKFYGRRLLEIFEVCADDYAMRFSMPFIRDAVALYHEKAKTLVSDDAFEACKTQILEMETHRAEVYLHEPHRSDYVATITELFGLGDEKFQRP